MLLSKVAVQVGVVSSVVVVVIVFGIAVVVVVVAGVGGAVVLVPHWTLSWPPCRSSEHFLSSANNIKLNLALNSWPGLTL